jgi:hypothetical protein
LDLTLGYEVVAADEDAAKKAAAIGDEDDADSD